MRELVLAAIGVYQRHVSPYKGFCCAYRSHTGAASCSALGARVIRRHGLFAGCVLLRQRLKRCGEVHRRFHPPEPRQSAAQRGDCDIGGCDVPGGDGCDVCDVCDCGGCDWPASKRKERPPARSRRDSKGSRWDELADSDRSRRRDS